MPPLRLCQQLDMLTVTISLTTLLTILKNVKAILVIVQDGRWCSILRLGREPLLFQYFQINIPEVDRLPFALQGYITRGQGLAVNFLVGCIAVHHRASDLGF